MYSKVLVLVLERIVNERKSWRAQVCRERGRFSYFSCKSCEYDAIDIPPQRNRDTRFLGVRSQRRSCGDVQETLLLVYKKKS